MNSRSIGFKNQFMLDVNQDTVTAFNGGASGNLGKSAFQMVLPRPEFLAGKKRCHTEKDWFQPHATILLFNGNQFLITHKSCRNAVCGHLCTDWMFEYSLLIKHVGIFCVCVFVSCVRISDFSSKPHFSSWNSRSRFPAYTCLPSFFVCDLTYFLKVAFLVL